MRLTAVLAIACLVALAFAGCSGKDKDGGTTSSSSSSSSRPASSSSTSSHSSTSATGSSSSTSASPLPNHAPSGSVSAVTNGTRATFALNATDADVDALSWTLTFGDGNSTNGTTLPSTVAHNYTAAGNFSANFTVTDGKDPVTYNVTVPVGAGVAGTPQHVAGSFTTTPIDCNVFAGVVPMTSGVTHLSADVAAGTIGQAYKATFKGTAPSGFSYFIEWDDSGANVIQFDGTDATTLTGTVPAKAAKMYIFSCVNTPLGFTGTGNAQVEATYDTPA